MDTVGNILGRAFERLEEDILSEESKDYTNEVDGLVYCGLCNTPKQQIVEMCGEKRKVPKNCTCKQKKMEKEQKEMQRRILIAGLREQAFEDSLLLKQTFEKEDGSLEHRILGERYVEKFEEMEKENIGLLLTGPVGTGKTYLASAIANALIEKEISVKMTNFAIILNDMMNLEINKNKYIEKLNGNRLLIIDDFGIQRDTAFATEHIFNIIDSRYRANKPIILTTNLTISQLTDPNNLKEERIYSRILEMASPVIFTKENRRIAKMKEKARKANMFLMNR